MSIHTYFENKQKTANKLADRLQLKKNELFCRREYALSENPNDIKVLVSIQAMCNSLQNQLDQVKYLLDNPNVLAQEYVDSLPANRTRLDISRFEYEPFKITRIPDLSRFTQLEFLNVSLHEDLVEGFDTLPVTLKKLLMYKTKLNPSADWLPRLVNLEYLNFHRNDSVRKMPDLSGLTKLTTLLATQCKYNILEFTRLPLSIKTLEISNIQQKYLTRQEWVLHNHTREKIDYIFEGATAKQWVEKINRVNQFDTIRDELLSTAAKMALNPRRIDRILRESGMSIGDYDAILDAYELQPRQKYYYY